MKILFVGYGKVGAVALKKILENKLDVVKVIIPKGGGSEEVKRVSEESGVSSVLVHNKESLEDHILNTRMDIIAVGSCPYLFSKKVVNYPRLGIINLHASDLPRYRGYHPIVWAVINGEDEIGVSVNYIDEGMDRGDILAKDKIKILNADDINSLIQKAADRGASILVDTLIRIKKNNKKLKGEKQRESDATFAPKRYPKDSRLKWDSKTTSIANFIRALKSPYPNAFTKKRNSMINITESFIPKKPGEVLGKFKGWYVVAALDGVVLVKTDKKVSIGDVLK